VYELEYPLGRRNDYEETLKHQVEGGSGQKNFKKIDYRCKYECHKEKNMILPQKAILNLMIELDLPVYNNYKVHFKDVCIKLS